MDGRDRPHGVDAEGPDRPPVVPRPSPNRPSRPPRRRRREQPIRAAGSAGVHTIHTHDGDDDVLRYGGRPPTDPRAGARARTEASQGSPPTLRTRARPSPSPWSEAPVNVSVMQENLARGLSVVSRAVSTRSTLPVLGNVLHPDRGRRPEADRHEPRDRDHLLGPGQDRQRRRDHRAGPAAHRRRRGPAGRRAGRPRAPGRRHPADPLPAGSRRTSRASTPRSSRPSRRPASGRRPGSPRRSLRQALNETTFAAASDEARPILTGVLCRFEGDQLTLAAADNYRIAVKTIPTLDPVEETSARRPGPFAATSSAGSWPTSTIRSRSSWPRHATRSCSTSRASTWSAG